MSIKDIEELCCSYTHDDDDIEKLEYNQELKQLLQINIPNIISNNKYFTYQIVDLLSKLSYGKQLVIDNLNLILLNSDSILLKKVLGFGKEYEQLIIIYIENNIESIINNIPLFDIPASLLVLKDKFVHNETKIKIEQFIVNNFEKIMDTTLHNENNKSQKYYRLSNIKILLDYCDKNIAHDLLNNNYYQLYNHSYKFDHFLIFNLCKKYGIAFDRSIEDLICDCVDNEDNKLITIIVEILKKLSHTKQIPVSEMEFIGSGVTTASIKIDDIIFKIGTGLKTYNCPESELIINSLYQIVITTNNGEKYLLDIQPFLNTNWYIEKGEVEVNEILYYIYSSLRKKRSVWTDISEKNVGLLEQNGSKRYFIFDKDYIFREGAENITIGNARYGKFEERYMNEQEQNNNIQECSILSSESETDKIVDSNNEDNLFNKKRK